MFLELEIWMFLKKNLNLQTKKLTWNGTVKDLLLSELFTFTAGKIDGSSGHLHKKEEKQKS